MTDAVRPCSGCGILLGYNGRGAPSKYCGDCKARKARERHRKRSYGIDDDQYRALLEMQGGRCAICGSDDPKGGRWDTFAVDHCHETGEVRGLLCEPCNLGLGKFQDSPELLRKAARYLEARGK